MQIYNLFLYIYIYIYIYINFNIIYIYILKWVGPRRDLYFLRVYLFVVILHTCMFPAWCFCQRTCMTQSLVNGVFNEIGTHSWVQFEWFSVGYGFLWRSLLFFLEWVYPSLLYSSFAFDITLCVCLCACWSGFGFHSQLFLLSVYVWMSVLRFFSCLW